MNHKFFAISLYSLFVLSGVAMLPLAHADCSDPAAPGVNWSGCDFTGSDLSSLDLSGADLSSGDFTGSDFSDTILAGADLSDADFTSSVFRNANFTDADATGSTFVDANFIGTITTGADFAGSDLTGVIFEDTGAGAATGDVLLTMVNPEPGNNDNFGKSIAVTTGDDTEFIIVGTPSDDFPNQDVGSVYVYDVSTCDNIVGSIQDDNICDLATLKLPNPIPDGGGIFGHSVGADFGGNVIVGAPYNHGGSSVGSGAAYIFDIFACSFSDCEIPKLTLSKPSGQGTMHFGWSVAVTPGGDFIVGSPGDSFGNFERTGSVHLYDLKCDSFDSNPGDKICDTPKLTIRNPSPEFLDVFGRSVSSTPDGKIIVGAHRDNTGAVLAGQVYMFDPETCDDDITAANSAAGDGICETAMLTINHPTPEENNHFGEFVGSTHNGNIIVGVAREPSNSFVGSVYIYDPLTCDNIANGVNENNNICENATLSIPNPTPVAGDNFGRSVTSLPNGNLIIGATSDRSPPFPTESHSGSVYLYDGATGEFLDIMNNPILTGPNFGSPILSSLNDNIVVGTPSDGAGSVHLIEGFTQEPPSPINDLTATPSDFSVDLSWSTPNNNGATITDYVIEFKLSSDANYQTFDDGTSSATTATVTGLSSKTQYDFRVFAVNSEVTSDPSNVVTVTTDSPACTTQVVSPINDLFATPGIASVDLSWSAPLGGVSFYVVEFKLSSETDYQTFDDGLSDNTMVTVTGLSSKTQYDFRVDGVYCGDKTTGPSNVVMATPTPFPGTLLFTINNPTPESSDLFGHSVASTANGDILIGANLDNIGAKSAGSAYLYDGTTGEVPLTINNPTPEPNDFFGYSVASTTDGDFIIGAIFDNTGAGSTGSAYLYDGATGEVLLTMNNPTPEPRDQFGFSVASTANDNILIGANLDNTGATSAGSAYLFDGTTGDLLFTMNNPTPENNDQFGYSVASAPDGDVIVSALRDNTGATSAGSVYLYDGTTGDLLLTINNPTPQKSDYFGSSVASAPNGHILVSAVGDNTGATSAGSAYLFDGVTGDLLLTLNNPTPDGYDYFGSSVSSTANGDVIVGAIRDNTGATNAGSAYVFDGTTGELLLTLNNPTPQRYDYFGSSVASTDGDEIIVGTRKDNTGAVNAGSVYLFQGK